MRCDKNKAQLFSSTGAKNEHTPGGQAEMRNGFVRHGTCRAHPQAAPVCVMSPALLEGACGRKEKAQGSHAFQAVEGGQSVHTSWVRVHDGERSLRGESICGLSTGVFR